MSLLSLPTLRHDQSLILLDPHPWKVIRCGRRYGKTKLLEAIAENGAAYGEPIGIYAPKFDTLTEVFRNIRNVLDPIIKTSSQGHEIRTSTGGAIDFWSLQPGGLFGRGRKYKKILIDEAAFAHKETLHEYMTAISKTQLEFPDLECYVFSTPEEPNLENFFYSLHEHKNYKYDPTVGPFIPGKSPSDHINYGRFKPFWRPTHANPLITRAALESERRTLHPLAFQQEILAQFVDWSGTSLFEALRGSVDPHPYYDHIFCIIDTAMKSGIKHDGCAVMWFGFNEKLHSYLHVLDWEIVSLDAVNQAEWLAKILSHSEALATFYKTIYGFTTCWIEDKQSGTILLQMGKDQGLPVEPINSKYTALGKDERARTSVNPVFRQDVKFIHSAYTKVVAYKEEVKNHALTQIFSYRIGDKESYKRADDLSDCFFYGIIQALVPELRERD